MAGPGKRGRKLSRYAIVDEDKVPNNTNVSESMTNMNATGSGSYSTSSVVLEHEIVGLTIGSGSSSSSHATRGQTRNLSLDKKKDFGVAVVIELNEDSGRIVGKDSGLYITESGCVVRKLGRFDVAKWANLDEDLKKDLINIAKARIFSYNKLTIFINVYILLTLSFIRRRRVLNFQIQLVCKKQWRNRCKVNSRVDNILFIRFSRNLPTRKKH